MLGHGERSEWAERAGGSERAGVGRGVEQAAQVRAYGRRLGLWDHGGRALGRWCLGGVEEGVGWGGGVGGGLGGGGGWEPRWGWGEGGGVGVGGASAWWTGKDGRSKKQWVFTDAAPGWGRRIKIIDANRRIFIIILIW